MIATIPPRPTAGTYTGVAPGSDKLSGTYTGATGATTTAGNYVTLEASPSASVVGTYVDSHGSLASDRRTTRQAIMAVQRPYVEQILEAVR